MLELVIWIAEIFKNFFKKIWQIVQNINFSAETSD